MKQMGIVADRLMINQCFYHFKHLYRDMLKKQGKGGGGGAKDAGGFSGPNFGNAPMPSGGGGGGGAGKDMVSNQEVKKMESEMQRLQALVQQRDNEIAILLSHVNKKTGGGADFGASPGVPLQRSMGMEESKEAGGGGP